jgi:competence protein ComEC
MCDVGQGDAMVLQSAGQVAVIDVGREPDAVDACLDRIGVRHIDLLVLTHFDMDHVGGITGAIDGRTVDIVLETPWPDTRPTVGFINRTLNEKRARVVFAQSGLSGHLGSLNWRVLSPSKTASEAEDSNDGSVILSFESKDYNLLALADLGERGQMRLVEQNPDLVRELSRKPMIVKVAHHGSADIYPELYEALKPTVALIGVGIENGYGHPTKRALEALSTAETKIFRTDRDGSIAVRVEPGKASNSPPVITVAVSGGG